MALILRQIDPAAPLPKIIEIINENMEQILLNGGGPKGDSIKGNPGPPGATKVGKKGLKGDRGKSLFAETSTLADSAAAVDDDHQFGDVIVDANSNVFTVINDGNDNRIYRFEFSINEVTINDKDFITASDNSFHVPSSGSISLDDNSGNFWKIIPPPSGPTYYEINTIFRVLSFNSIIHIHTGNQYVIVNNGATLDGNNLPINTDNNISKIVPPDSTMVFINKITHYELLFISRNEARMKIDQINSLLSYDNNYPLTVRKDGTLVNITGKLLSSSLVGSIYNGQMIATLPDSRYQPIHNKVISARAFIVQPGIGFVYDREPISLEITTDGKILYKRYFPLVIDANSPVTLYIDEWYDLLSDDTNDTITPSTPYLSLSDCGSILSDLDYDDSDSSTACGLGGGSTTLYLLDPIPYAGQSMIFTSSSYNTFASAGWYSDGVIFYEINSSGVIENVGICGSYSLLDKIRGPFGSQPEACGGGAGNTTFYVDGDVIVSSIAYTDSTLIDTAQEGWYSDGVLYYKIDGSGAIDQIGVCSASSFIGSTSADRNTAIEEYFKDNTSTIYMTSTDVDSLTYFDRIYSDAAYNNPVDTKHTTDGIRVWETDDSGTITSITLISI